MGNGVTRVGTRVGSVLAAVSNRIAGGLAVVSALCICLVAVSVSADVARRQILGPAIPGVVEFSVVLLVVMVFFGLAQAQRTGQEITVDVLTSRMSERPRALVEGIALLLALAVLAPMLLATWDNALASYLRGEYRYGLLRVPVWPARMAIPVGLAAYVLMVLVALVARARQLLGAGGRRPQEDTADALKHGL